ncbi:MAG: hypothetical protein Q8O76_14465 [Chloroflexota bacterium]|nr:hypothetical protein [Chloroflexota bacterium]
MCVKLDTEGGDDKPKRHIESRRFGVEIEVEGISTEQAGGNCGFARAGL